MPEATAMAFQLISGGAHAALAEALAAELGVALSRAEITPFADGELRVHVADPVRNTSVFVVQPTCPPVNENLMVLALLIDAIRAAGASHVTALVPYFGYARQEQRSREGDSRSAQVAARLLGSVGLDHLVTLDLHAPALESAFPFPVTHLPAQEIFLALIQGWALGDCVVVSPDAGGLKRAQRFATALGAPVAVVTKGRQRPDVSVALQVLGNVTGKTCILVDDIASTGRTLAGAAAALKDAGATEINAVFTHPIMAPGALDRLLGAPIARLATSNSIAIAPHPRLEIVSIAPLLAQSVRKLCGLDA
ncbi:MAG: ribose-phosphate pyrophosphokinase [Planctomycetia bacterium]|nr:ribose-phosphate pyrophosphokinase [Planctomycetia bacterium]